MEIGLVEFDHGVRGDLLTGAPMPTDFYRSLLRAIAMRRRNGGALFIITIKVLVPAKNYKSGSQAESRQLKEFKEVLLNTSKLIKKNLRTQDIFTRMSVVGFYILISGEKEEETNLVERFKKLFADRSLYQVNASKLVGDISPSDWLNLIDQNFFSQGDY